VTIYPLPMRWPTKAGHIDITIDRQNWRFCTTEDEARFRELPVSDRLELRSAFAAQVELAKTTK
jgi:hypothetical protein